MNNLEMYINKLKASKKSKYTIEAYTRDITQMLNYVNKNETQVSYADLIGWQASISDLSSATVSRKIVSVNRFFKFLEDIEVISTNPASKLESPHIENKAVEYIPIEDATKLIHVGKNARDKAIVAVYLSTGLRVQEVIDLKLSDYKNDSFVVNTKGNKLRTIYLNEDCKKYVDEYLKTRKDFGDVLFVSNQGTKMSRVALNNTLKVLAKKCGLPTTIHNHTLRHAFTSNVCDNYGIQVAKDVLNHSSVSVTERYCHNKENTIKNVMTNIKL